MRYFFISLFFVASLCRADTFTPVPSKIVGPGGSKISIEGGNATIQPSSGGAVNVVTGDVYVPTVLNFSTSVSPLVSASGHSSLAFDGTNLKLSVNGGSYGALGVDPANPPAWGTGIPNSGAFTTLSASGTLLTNGVIARPGTLTGSITFTDAVGNIRFTAEMGGGNFDSVGGFTYAGGVTYLGSGGLDLSPAQKLIWRDATFGTQDLFLLRAAANTLALRNGGAAQTLGMGPATTAGLLLKQASGVLTARLGDDSADAGLGCGTLAASGAVTFTGTTDSTSSSTGSAIFSGGVAINKKVWIGTAGTANSLVVANSGSNGTHSTITDGTNGIRFDGAQDRFALFTNGGGDMLYLRGNGGASPYVQIGGVKVEVSGNVVCVNAGNGLQLKSGTGARAGHATLVGGTITIANTTVTSNTECFPVRKTPGGTLGQSLSWSVVAGTSLTITSVDATGVLSALDTSVVSYHLIEVNP